LGNGQKGKNHTSKILNRKAYIQFALAIEVKIPDLRANEAICSADCCAREDGLQRKARPPFWRERPPKRQAGPE